MIFKQLSFKKMNKEFQILYKFDKKNKDKVANVRKIAEICTVMR